jgi:hypothetical protein
MRLLNWLPVIFLILLIYSCYNTWIIIPEKNIVVTGFDASKIGFGKPGIMHVFLAALVFIFLLLGKVWSKRAAFFVSAFNIAWAIRNFIAISTCQAGICPQKQPWFYFMLISSIAITISLLFGGVTEKKKTIKE